MNAFGTPSLNERVAVIETEVHGLSSTVDGIKAVQGHQEAVLNTICVNVATLTTEVKNITMERTVWKNPLIYISFISVVVAGLALFK
jgi:hypothetical protein